MIHPYFPLLAHRKSRIQHDLDQTSPEICEAFFAAVDAANALCTSPRTDTLVNALRQLTTLRLEKESKTRSPPANLVCLQILILLIIADDNAGPSRPQQRITIARAVDFASSMRLHQSHSLPPSSDDDSNSSLCRRAWLVLTILDRWHAASTSGTLMVDEDTVQLVESDENLLGTLAFHLVGKCLC